MIMDEDDADNVGRDVERNLHIFFFSFVLLLLALCVWMLIWGPR